MPSCIDHRSAQVTQNITLEICDLAAAKMPHLLSGFPQHILAWLAALTLHPIAR